MYLLTKFKQPVGYTIKVSLLLWFPYSVPKAPVPSFILDRSLRPGLEVLYCCLCLCHPRTGARAWPSGLRPGRPSVVPRPQAQCLPLGPPRN